MYTCATVIKILRYDITVRIQSAGEIRSFVRPFIDILQIFSIFVLIVIKEDVVIGVRHTLRRYSDFPRYAS